MTSYWQLLALILPVFGLIGVGVLVRRVGWLTEEADASLLQLVVNYLYPCLIFENVLQNEDLKILSNLAFAPLSGYAAIVLCIGLAYYAGRLLGLTQGHGLRTFAFASGINNYGYLPIPLMAALFGPKSVGLLLVHNVGCEAAIWTVGILMLSGLSLRAGWRKLFNPPVASLILGLAANLLNLGRWLPSVVTSTLHQSALCAIPLGLILIGATLDHYLARPRELFEPRISISSVILRQGVFPVAYLMLAAWLPITVELKRVLVVQAAMPAAILPIVIAKQYGGRPLTAVQVVVATTVVGILVIPLWLRVGLAWVLP